MSGVIELQLDSKQSALFEQVLVVQRQHKKSAIFCVVTDSYLPEEGRGVVRLQAKLVDRKTAQRVVRLFDLFGGRQNRSG
jgi:hypothetical protein